MQLHYPPVQLHYPSVQTLPAAFADRRATESLIAVLKDDENWRVRNSAAQALGKIGDPRALRPLIAALKDESGYVRQSAVRAAGQMQEA